MRCSLLKRFVFSCSNHYFWMLLLHSCSRFTAVYSLCCLLDNKKTLFRQFHVEVIRHIFCIRDILFIWVQLCIHIINSVYISIRNPCRVFLCVGFGKCVGFRIVDFVSQCFQIAQFSPDDDYYVLCAVCFAFVKCAECCAIGEKSLAVRMYRLQ